MLQEFTQAVKDSVKKGISGIHTAMPGEILAYDSTTGLATVQPVMKFKKPDGTTIDFPQITGVPVLFQQGAEQGATLAFPVQAGDGCLIIVGEQSLDYWMYGQETSTDLAFDMTNAMCIPGLFKKPNAVVAEACEKGAVIIDAKGTRLVIKSGAIEIESTNIQLNGNVTVNGNFTASGGVVNLN